MNVITVTHDCVDRGEEEMEVCECVLEGEKKQEMAHMKLLSYGRFMNITLLTEY